MARVVIDETSEPLWASVVENAPRSSPDARPGRKRAFCSRLPRLQDAAEGHPLHDQQIAGVVADSSEFLDGNAAGQQAARAAMLPRQGDCEQAELPQQLEHVLRVFGLAVDLIRARRHALARDPAAQILDGELLVVQFVGHGGSGSGRNWTSRRRRNPRLRTRHGH